MSNLGSVVGVVGAVIAFAVSLYLVEPSVQANDRFYRLNDARCQLAAGQETTKRMVVAPDSPADVLMGPGTIVNWTEGSTEGTCQVSPSATTGATVAVIFLTEDGTRVPLTAASNTLPALATTVGRWVPEPSYLSGFGGIARLIISLVPLSIAVGFVAYSFRVVKSGTERAMAGEGILSASIITDIGTMLVLVISCYVAEPLMQAIGAAATVSTDGHLSSTDQFGSVQRLIYSIMVVGYAAGVVGLAFRPTFGVAKRGIGYGYRRLRGEM